MRGQPLTRDREDEGSALDTRQGEKYAAVKD